MKKASVVAILAVLAACGRSVRVDDVPLAGAWLRGTKTVIVIERGRATFLAPNGTTNFGAILPTPEGAYRIVEDVPSAEYLAAYFPAAAAKALSAGAETFSAEYVILSASPTNLAVEAHIRQIECDAAGVIYDNRPLTRVEAWTRKP